ncbi:PLDc N-terminal domain-containing protein [Mycolicibacterium palauense]|uniref:PLDc N-terminal domain-containing protein n=1 Tax=Mycolicibacterium palauense TaxID=2034511 RepID=UPI000BFEC4BB|nr:PLDc N-terminal domain-containing protein [Mycolicibacterium palauense]
MSLSGRRFSELSTRSRVLIVVGAIVQVLLQAAALRDIRNRPAAQINGSKPLWVCLSFLNFVGPIAYFAVGRRRARSAERSIRINGLTSMSPETSR